MTQAACSNSGLPLPEIRGWDAGGGVAGHLRCAGCRPRLCPARRCCTQNAALGAASPARSATVLTTSACTTGGGGSPSGPAGHQCQEPTGTRAQPAHCSTWPRAQVLECPLGRWTPSSSQTPPRGPASDPAGQLRLTLLGRHWHVWDEAVAGPAQRGGPCFRGRRRPGLPVCLPRQPTSPLSPQSSVWPGLAVIRAQAAVPRCSLLSQTGFDTAPPQSGARPAHGRTRLSGYPSALLPAQPAGVGGGAAGVASRAQPVPRPHSSLPE